MEYEQIFRVTHVGKYHCKNMKYRIMVPITGRARSFLIFSEFSKTKERGGATEKKQKQPPQTTSTPPNPNLYHTQ